MIHTSETDPLCFGEASPILRVENADASVTYYVDVLGFKVDFQLPGFAAVSRDRCRLFLCEGDQGNSGAWIWIGVGDVEPLFDRYRASGARIRHPPTNYSWALEMQIEDIDGNVLRIGSDNKKDKPIGEWLDMRGIRWFPRVEGGWKREDDD